VEQALGDITDLQIDLITPGRELLQQSTRNTFLYDATIYDSCYLALAELMGIQVYASDRWFYEKAKATGIIRLI
jgi:predicted nucleic acid-binding protein